MDFFNLILTKEDIERDSIDYSKMFTDQIAKNSIPDEWDIIVPDTPIGHQVVARLPNYIVKTTHFIDGKIFFNKKSFSDQELAKIQKSINCTL